jgi:hypothetical protein
MAPPVSIIIWVATTGDDTSGDGTQSNPYKTIEKAISVFNNGDQIRILSGTYIPTDSIVISGLDGSIFSETPNGVYIQPQKTTLHQACVAILDAARFTVQGINVIQAADPTGNYIGLYAENVENFIAYTCDVSNFLVSGGACHGIYASGNGRVEHCKVSNLVADSVNLYGIRTKGVHVIDCTVTSLSGIGGNVFGIYEEGLKSP